MERKGRAFLSELGAALRKLSGRLHYGIGNLWEICVSGTSAAYVMAAFILGVDVHFYKTVLLPTLALSAIKKP